MLHFLFGLIIVGVIIMMMVAYPAFRNFVLLLLIAGGIGIWALIENSNKQSQEYEKKRMAEQLQQAAQEQFATTAIKTGDVQLDDVRLTKATNSTLDFVLSGTVTNNSQYALGSMSFEVTMTDCNQGKCVTVGQQVAYLRVQVPSAQRRAFSSSAVRFDNLPPSTGAERNWTYKLVSTRAN
jgi:flagellar biosynthesis component FlhA